MCITAICPAKVNLSLNITGQDPQSQYHFIESIIAFSLWGDVITLRPAASDHLTVYGDFPAPENLNNNLIFQAKSNLETLLGEKLPCFDVTLYKYIPMGAGLGGGSSNAATFLRLLKKYFMPELSDDIILQAAQNAGADIPVCYYNRPCFVSGFGEIIRPLPRRKQIYPIIFIKPLQGIETANIFKALKQKNNPSIFDNIAYDNYIQHALTHGTNDLTDISAQFLPEIKEILSLFELLPTLSYGMSGSGSACFAIYDNMDDANMMYKKLHNLKNKYFIYKSHIVL